MEIYLDDSGAKMSSDARNISLGDVKWLLIAYAALVAVKAVLSLKFQSPWIFPDESTYALVARDAFGSQYSAISRSYPIFLSVAYFFSTDMMIVYHIMLLVNCLLSSTILFPSYFILAKYCPKGYSFVAALTVAHLPSLTLYTFLLMTENLFVPLFIFSMWFALEAYEARKPFWICLTVISVVILFFTRHTGIFMVAGLALSFGYYILAGFRIRHKVGLFDNKNLSLLLGSLIFLVSLGLYVLGPKFPDYFPWFWNRMSSDGMVLVEIVGNPASLARFASLLVNELGYVIVSSYFIIFFLAVAFIFSAFGISRIKSPSISSWFDSLGTEKARSLKAVAIYFLMSSFAMVFGTAVSVYHLNVDIIGRYVDPVTPGLFLFAFIGLYRIYGSEEFKDFWKHLASLSVFSLAFFLNFPYLTPNIISIFYINYFKSLFPNWMIFPILSLVFLTILYMSRNSWRLLFGCLVLFSACTSAYTYNADLSLLSEMYHSQNQVGDYLNQHTNDSSLVLIDVLDVKRDIYIAYTNRFWSKGQVIEYFIPEDFSTMGADGTGNPFYIISSKVLPFPTLAISTREYSLYLYGPNSTSIS